MPNATARNDVQPADAREELVIANLLAGRSVREISESTGFSRTTIWRIRRAADFQRKFESARQEAFEQAVNVLHDSATVFARTLAAVCNDDKARGSEKATAARSGLDSLWKAKELFNFEQRLQKLERSAAEEEKPTDNAFPRQPSPPDWISPEKRESLEKERTIEGDSE
jgi:hypothetical protein